MFFLRISIIFVFLLSYQSYSYSKSASFIEIDSKNFSNYFSGIVAFENNENSKALEFFDSSKTLLNHHDPYLKRLVFSLVLENNVSEAIKIIKKNKGRNNLNFFESHLLLILDSLIKNNFDKAYSQVIILSDFAQQDKFHSAIIESLKQYIYVFKEKKTLANKKNFGKLSFISETFQKCFLKDITTETYFTNLFNDPEADYTRYIFFYLSYLIENNKVDEAVKIVNEIDYINSTILLSQGKNWIENKNLEKLTKVFSCNNSNDIISEFLFLLSNLYSSQDDFEKSNFYLNLSSFLNPKFVFNLTLIVENLYLNKEYEKAKMILKNFKKEDSFYFWYRIKKEAQIISKQKNKKESLNFITAEFEKIDNPNNRMIMDIANFFKNSREYDKAISYYTKVINSLDEDSKIKSDLLYRRGGSYERIGDYEKADKDLLDALKIDPEDAYILNYLAYSWLERDYKINEAIEMLEIAYASRSNDPYIIDSIGWAYYLINEYQKAEQFLRRAVELMPNDPIVNDHYGDILWKLNRKIQARYFWANVLNMNDVDNEMIEKINLKLVKGLKS